MPSQYSRTTAFFKAMTPDDSSDADVGVGFVDLAPYRCVPGAGELLRS